MGYDCTLHLVDEEAIRNEFVPKLLGESTKTTALDRAVADAPKLWKKARNALVKGNPDAATATICQLAIMFSASSLPHQYERGLALCLWARSDPLETDYPGTLAFSPEPLFAAVVAKYPKVQGCFPTWFEGNGSTGVFVPSDRVAEVLAWVEARLATLDKGDQRTFKGLLRVLRTAAEKKLAYWEATDLAVPMAGEFPGDPALMTAAYLGNEPGSPGPRVEEFRPQKPPYRYGQKLVGDWMVSSNWDPLETDFWDLSVWPPRLAWMLKEFCPYPARGRDGRWLLCSATDPNAKPRFFCPRVFRADGGACLGAWPVPGTEPDCGVHHGGFVGDVPLVFMPVPRILGAELAPPRWLQDNQWVPAPGLPRDIAQASVLPLSVETPERAVVPLNDGSDVVIWAEHGYELRGGRFERTFELGVRSSHSDWRAVAHGEDGFYFLSNRQLFLARRGAPPQALVSKWTNVMEVHPGPQGSVLLSEGKNKDGDVAKLYFPADDTFVHLEPELFDDKDYTFIRWAAAADRFVVYGVNFLAVRTATVLALPRYRASTGRKVKAT